MSGEYDDIINLPRHVSKKRPQMPISHRAAQFSPFAALAGHGEAVEETARLTEERLDLDEYMKEALNNKLQIIRDKLKEHPEIEITYFKPDEKKSGGTYITTTGIVKKLDTYEGFVIMTDCIEIPMDEIIKIEGQIFDTME